MDFQTGLLQALNQSIDCKIRFWYIEHQAKVHCDLAQTDSLLSCLVYQNNRESVFLCNENVEQTRSKST